MAPLLRLTHVVILLLFFACGRSSFFFSFTNDGAGTGLPPPPQQEESPLPESFSTQVNESLLISGDKCQGGETIGHGNEFLTCSTNQYVISLNGVPLIGNLEEVPGTNSELFDIVPLQPATEAQIVTLDPWQVRIQSDGSAIVVPEAGP